MKARVVGGRRGKENVIVLIRNFHGNGTNLEANACGSSISGRSFSSDGGHGQYRSRTCGGCM